MGLTKKGEQALKNLTKVTIEKTQLNRIFVNLITGELYLQEPVGLTQRPLPSSIYLDETVRVDVEYFHGHFEYVNAIYESSLVSNIFELGPTDPCELYKILDIAYQETRFLPVPCFVYIKPGKNEVFLSFDSDKDSILMSTALTQIKERSNGLEKLFDNPLPSSTPNDNPELAKKLQNLLSIIQLRNKSKVSTQEIEEMYFADRLLLDGEVRDILIQCDTFKPTALCISTPFLRRLFEDNEIIHYLVSSKVKDIFIEYNADEYKVEDSIKRLTERITDGKNVHLCSVSGPAKIAGDTFLIYPQVLIKTQYQNIHINIPQKVLHKPNSIITFDKAQIEKIYSHYEKALNPQLMTK